ncbi:hypothetical protein Psal027_00304 [Piscirickettsia salmonis]|nr:hypothetical protein Psal001_00306 [Piscirickettsia salmonis]QGN79695.1 hypothetical protein Psal002_00304 [Piscirickettsia salmonis]QGN83284.1 hypothetical protein Psal003_00303 [Piscirickettsia salmonis]QGN86798.1 hypothetical protein Psal004_00303 [Piscirickettsia salmonis]QGO08157.1 hypothetical protein Psal010a_00303 [Piscirickettsia salmonis]
MKITPIILKAILPMHQHLLLRVQHKVQITHRERWPLCHILGQHTHHTGHTINPADSEARLPLHILRFTVIHSSAALILKVLLLSIPLCFIISSTQQITTLYSFWLLLMKATQINIRGVPAAMASISNRSRKLSL